MDIASRILSNQDRDGMLRRSLERIIQLYTDRSHFIYELLQNAEDAGATSIRFVQHYDRLVVMHNGAAFTRQNLQGLCDIGKSDKTKNLNQIGEFGVGFKSVFSICEKVRLYSTPREEEITEDCFPFAVEIQDFTKPVDIEYSPVQGEYTTQFIFPYKVGETFSGYKTQNELRDKVASRLKNLGITTLLFMRNLSVIKYEIDCFGKTQQGQYMLSKEAISKTCTKVFARETENKTTDAYISFLKFSLPIQAEASNRTLDIAFQMSTDKNGNTVFQPAKDPYISVYFPTETESKLQFIVQGPFRTTPNRSSVPTDDETNIKFAKIMSNLLHNAILEVRDMGLLDLSFIKILPINENAFRTNDLFLPLYNTVKEMCETAKIIPTKEEKVYTDAGHALVDRNRELSQLLDSKNISQLINDGKTYHWLPNSINDANVTNRDIYSFMTGVLGINIIRPEDLRVYFNTNQEFLKTKENPWLMRLYKIYEGIPALFSKTNSRGNILDMKIIRTRSGLITAPYRKTQDGYLPNVFLSDNSNYINTLEYVDPELEAHCLSFFKDVLHLTAPNRYELFTKKLMLQYQDPKNIDLEMHLQDMQIAVQYLRYPDYSSDIKRILSKHFYIRVRQNGATVWVKPFNDPIYFPVGENEIMIEKYYQGLPGTEDNMYLDFDLYQSSGLDYSDMKLFDIIGTVLTDFDTTFGDYKPANINRNVEWHTNGAFRWKLSIDMIDDALVYISTNPKASSSIIKSQTIFKLLMMNQTRLMGDVLINSTKVDDLYNTPAEILRILKGEKKGYILNKWNGKWLYTGSMELVSQFEISKRDLNESLYGKFSMDSNIYDLLGFKKNKTDKLEDVVKEYDKLPEDKQTMYFEIALQRKFGLTVDQLKAIKKGAPIPDTDDSPYYGTQEDEPFEFPAGNIRDWDALKNHAAQILSYAAPVKYQELVRSIRVSRPVDNIRAYLQNMYRVNSSYKYACQICHKPHSNIQVSQLEYKPKLELEPLNLCLCPNCHASFFQYRSNSLHAKALIDKILAYPENRISQEDHITITIQGMEIWFTQTHFAEIVELLKLRKATDDKIDIKEGRVHVSGAPQPINLESRTQIADPNTPSSYLKTVTEQENDEADLRTKEHEEKPSDLIDYKKYIGTRVYHTAVKQCATVLDCDEVNIVLMFDGAEKENTYKLQMCLQKDWLRFEWDPDFKTIENETANQKPEGNTDNSTAEDQTYRTIPVKGDIAGDYQLVPLSKKQKDEKNRTMYLAMKKNGVDVEFPINVSESSHKIFIADKIYDIFIKKTENVKALKIHTNWTPMK